MFVTKTWDKQELVTASSWGVVLFLGVVIAQMLVPGIVVERSVPFSHSPLLLKAD